MTNTMQPEISVDHARQLIDHGAQQGPNWWMALIAVVAFGVLILAAMRGAKWIIGRHEALTADLRESNKEQVRMLTGVVERNTVALISNDARIATMGTSIEKLMEHHRMSLRRDQQAPQQPQPPKG